MRLWKQKVLTLLPFLFVMVQLIDARFGYLLFDEVTLAVLIDILTNTLPLFIFVIVDIYRRKLQHIMQMIVLASFYVYALSVFYLTVFPLSWENFVANEFWFNGINLTPFEILNDYSIVSEQIIGNFIMLMPLGIYIHLLFKKMDTPGRALLLLFATSLAIEVTQLLFMVGRTDVDDLLLNTSGGYVAFLIWLIGKTYFNKQTLDVNKIS